MTHLLETGKCWFLGSRAYGPLCGIYLLVCHSKVSCRSLRLPCNFTNWCILNCVLHGYQLSKCYLIYWWGGKCPWVWVYLTHRTIQNFTFNWKKKKRWTKKVKAVKDKSSCRVPWLANLKRALPKAIFECSSKLKRRIMSIGESSICFQLYW